MVTLANAGTAIVLTLFGTRSVLPATWYPQEHMSHRYAQIDTVANLLAPASVRGLLRELTCHLDRIFRGDSQIIGHHPEPAGARIVPVERDRSHRDTVLSGRGHAVGSFFVA